MEIYGSIVGRTKTVCMHPVNNLALKLAFNNMPLILLAVSQISIIDEANNNLMVCFFCIDLVYDHL